MRMITKLEPYGARIKIYIDGALAFLLYKGEVRKFHLEENKEISNETYERIIELQYQRAKERALYIIESSYKTEKQVRDKLRKSCYPEEVIKRVIEFLIHYNFINDLRYALTYIEYKSSSKSKKQILQDLYIKGIKKEIVDEAFAENGYSDKISLDKTIDKRKSRYNLKDRKELQKFYQYLIGKGYSYHDVKTALSRYAEVQLEEP